MPFPITTPFVQNPSSPLPTEVGLTIEAFPIQTPWTTPSFVPPPVFPTLESFPTVTETMIIVYSEGDTIGQVIQETLNNSGGITSQHTLTQEEALELANTWLGDNYSQYKDGVYRSNIPNEDGTYNQYRMDSGSLLGEHAPNVSHIHLEIVRIEPVTGRGTFIVNNHIPIEGD